ncbi:11013_t:CDS:1, partial [Gigaspora margarita]
MEIDVLKGCIFNTFDKVRAVIEGYAGVIGKHTLSAKNRENI